MNGDYSQSVLEQVQQAVQEGCCGVFKITGRIRIVLLFAVEMGELC